MPPIDRISPARRPLGRAAGTQRWRDLLFLHWPVPAEAMRPLIPRGVELDLWEGTCFVGVVPFAMLDIASWWMPNAFALNFLETNVRTYVVHEGRPGVAFLSLEASSWLAVKVARAQWSLPYHHADMKLDRTGEQIAYTSRRRGNPAATLDVTWRIGAALGPSEPDTLEHFLLERYYLFVEKNNRLIRGQVHHTPYPAHRADLLSLTDGLVTATGLTPPSGPPAHIHYSPGVDVEVFAPEYTDARP